MQSRKSAHASVNSPYLFMCEHSVPARSAGPTVQARTHQCEYTLTSVKATLNASTVK